MITGLSLFSDAPMKCL